MTVQLVSSECMMPRDFADSHAACIVRPCECRCHGCPDPTALAARLVEIADDSRWPGILRAEAKNGVDGWPDEPPLNPPSLSDPDVRKALRARILARGKRYNPNAKPLNRDDMLTRLCRLVPDLSDAPPRNVLLAVLRSAAGGGVVNVETAAGGFVHRRELVGAGGLTERGRRTLDILDGVR